MISFRRKGDRFSFVLFGADDLTVDFSYTNKLTVFLAWPEGNGDPNVL